MSKNDDDAVELRVIGVVDETHDTRTIRLDNSEGRISPHRAGQHIKVRVDAPDGPAWRSFTLSSPPTRPGVLEITVKRKGNGDVSNAIHNLRPGDRLLLKGPSGRFVFDPETHREPLVLAVAGSGVTPALAILRTIHDLGLDTRVTLLYGCRTRDDVIFSRELEALRQAAPGVAVVISLTQPDSEWSGPTGRIGPELVARHVEDPASARFYVCGPGSLPEDLSTWLLEQGVPAERIHLELYGKKGNARPGTGH
jgi:ferredoxin-NADP reductase